MKYIENESTELKEMLNKDIKKEIVAFANGNGGRIYIGINDEGKVVGLKDINSDMEALSCMIREGIKSDLTLYTNIKAKKIENKDVIVLEIMNAPNKPYYLSNKGMKTSGVYLRYGNTTLPSNEEIIKKMIVDNRNQSFEMVEAINQNLHFDYFTHLLEKNNIKLNDVKMKTLNIINISGLYTNLGLLLSDECPFTIKCAIFDGNDKIEFKDRKEFTGSVLKQVNEVFEYLNLYNRIKGKIEGLKRIDIRDYPEYAIRESLLNAIIHRDYNYSGSILISLFDDHLEMTSLGGLVNGLNLKDIYTGISETRNNNLANIFYRLNYVESFGTGIERIMRSYDNYEKKPIINCSDNVFKITLYNINYVEDENVEKTFPFYMTQEEQIVEYLIKYGKINRIIVEMLLDVSKTRANDILNKMIKNNQIVQIGNGKNTGYVLNER